ncbi:MAG: hypothetical protein RLZZ511_2494 [Cyanobacteriota bacterium]|jgi:hypothetical protein
MKFGWIHWNAFFQFCRTILNRRSLIALGAAVLLWCVSQPAWAGLMDDNFDGEIFALYAGNGALVPPKNDLEATLKQGKAAVMVFYVDDSRDCKAFSLQISNLQAQYNKVVNFIPVRVDSIVPKTAYEKNDPGYYYKGYVPQTVIFNPQGEVQLDQSGQVSFETLDDTMRGIFNLEPRSVSVELKRRPINEVTVELTQ